MTDNEPTNIQALRGVDSIRLRPEMYLGKLADPASVTKMLIEAACLALDNVASGCASHVSFSLYSNGSASICDNGPGIDIKPRKDGHSLVEVILTCLHACRESKKLKLHSGDLCQLGIVVTNALSEWFVYETTQDGHLWRQEYVKGVPKADIQDLGPTTEYRQLLSFKPDKEILGATQISATSFVQWFQGLSLPLHLASITLSEPNGTITQLNPRVI